MPYVCIQIDIEVQIEIFKYYKIRAIKFYKLQRL